MEWGGTDRNVSRMILTSVTLRTVFQSYWDDDRMIMEG